MPYPPEELPQVGDTIRTCKANEGACTYLTHKNVGKYKEWCLVHFEVEIVLQGLSPEDNTTQYMLQLKSLKDGSISRMLIDWRWCSLIARNSIKGTIAEPEQPVVRYNRLSEIDE